MPAIAEGTGCDFRTIPVTVKPTNGQHVTVEGREDALVGRSQVGRPVYTSVFFWGWDEAMHGYIQCKQRVHLDIVMHSFSFPFRAVHLKKRKGNNNEKKKIYSTDADNADTHGGIGGVRQCS
jgi:hypothetical protein